MSGRPQSKKRLVRTRRVSEQDSSDCNSDALQTPDTPPWPSTRLMEPPPSTSSDVQIPPVSPLLSSWRRAAVRAVEIQANPIILSWMTL